MVVSHIVWVMGSELRSYGRAVSVFDYKTVQDLKFNFYCVFMYECVHIHLCTGLYVCVCRGQRRILGFIPQKIDIIF